MKTNNGKEILIRGRNREDDDGLIDILCSKMRNFLISNNIGPQKIEELSQANSVDAIIAKYSEFLLQNIPSYTDSLTAVHKQVIFYRQRLINHEKKIKDLKSQILTQMKALSNKQLELDQKQTQIFNLKTTIQQKERAIIQLKASKGKETKEIKKPLIPILQRQQPIKIMISSPKQIPKQSNKQKIIRAQKINQQAPSEWEEQKKRLVKVIKQKDLKIYELIQELQQRK